MTRSQFSLAVNADEKWIENSARLLGLSLRYTPEDSTWMGLLRLFNHTLGFTLSHSAQLATEALTHKPSEREVKLGPSSTSEVSIVLDAARYHSWHNAALSAALIMGGARRRGRSPTLSKGDALARAIAYGIDLNALREGLMESPATRLHRLQQNAEFIGGMKTAAASRHRPARSKSGK